MSCLAILAGCERGNDRLKYPSPQLAAEQALNLQLEALSHTGNTHRGVAQMYAFASPKSRSMMGSFDAFASLILEHMTPLVGHRSSQVHVLEQNPMRVSFQVTVQDQQGEEVITNGYSRACRRPIAQCAGSTPTSIPWKRRYTGSPSNSDMRQ